MNLHGLDEWITGNWGDDYWQEQEEYAHGFICGFCRDGACSYCRGGRCDCSGRYGRTASSHGPYQGPVRLVIDNTPVTQVENLSIEIDAGASPAGGSALNVGETVPLETAGNANNSGPGQLPLPSNSPVSPATLNDAEEISLDDNQD